MDVKPKRKTHTSTDVKRRYNEKTYARIYVQFPKALVAEFKQACIDRGVSQASVIQNAIEKFIMEDKKMTKIEMLFSCGEGRRFKGANYLISADKKIYAEVELPEGATPDNTEEDYGYLTMIEAIREKVPAEVLANYEFFYGPDFEFSPDASVDARVYVEYEED